MTAMDDQMIVDTYNWGNWQLNYLWFASTGKHLITNDSYNLFITWSMFHHAQLQIDIDIQIADK